MMTLDEMWSKMDDGQRKAIARKVARARTGDEKNAEQVLRAVLSGELRIVLVSKLVDRAGRGIQLPEMEGEVKNPDLSYRLTHDPDINAPYERLKEYNGFHRPFPSFNEVANRYGAALARVKANPLVSNLVKGPHFLFVISRMEGDPGELLERKIMPAFECSFRAKYPDRQFVNYRRGELAGKVTIVPGTRQERLVEAMAKGWVIGIYFPCLQGFSATAAREFITAAVTPKRLFLSGMEIPVVGTAYPEIIGHGWRTPGLDLAALRWMSEAKSLCCKADEKEFSFDCRDTTADSFFSGGFSILG